MPVRYKSLFAPIPFCVVACSPMSLWGLAYTAYPASARDLRDSRYVGIHSQD